MNIYLVTEHAFVVPGAALGTGGAADNKKLESHSPFVIMYLMESSEGNCSLKFHVCHGL